MSRRKYTATGDGDVCPIDPEHGQMAFITGTSRQWCPDQSHDGRPGSHPDGASAASRNLWPQGIDSFRRAVLTVTLPELDIAMLGG